MRSGRKLFSMKVLASLFLISAMALSGQTAKKQPPPPKVDYDAIMQQATEEAYAKASYRGSHLAKLFADDPRNTKFTLTTSWIPGPDAKGMFRYKLKVEVEPPTAEAKNLYNATPPPGGWGVPETLRRIHLCRYTLTLFDDGGFIVQKVPLQLIRTVDDAGIDINLATNETTPMSFTAYKSFMAADASDSWGVLWACE
jgi:hypothetical protein